MYVNNFFNALYLNSLTGENTLNDGIARKINNKSYSFN